MYFPVEFQNSLEPLGEVLDICNDTQDTLTSIEIPADVTMTTKELQTLVCGLNINETKLMEELYVGLDGLETLMDSVSNISLLLQYCRQHKHFLLFPQCFLTLPKRIFIFLNNNYFVVCKCFKFQLV